MKCSCQGNPHHTCIDIVPIFNGLTIQEKAEVASITREKTYIKSEIVYRAGEDAKKLYVVHTGRIKITRISPTGKLQVIRVVGPGEIMGELAILNQSPLNDYAEVIEPCSLCMIDGSRFNDLIMKHPSIALKVLGVLSGRLESAEGLIEDISLHTPEQRLSRAILDQSDQNNVVQLVLSKGDFASQLGMTQETLSRKLTLFKDEGLIEIKGRKEIIITNRTGLISLLPE